MCILMHECKNKIINLTININNNSNVDNLLTVEIQLFAFKNVSVPKFEELEIFYNLINNIAQNVT